MNPEQLFGNGTVEDKSEVAADDNRAIGLAKNGKVVEPAMEAYPEIRKDEDYIDAPPVVKRGIFVRFGSTMERCEQAFAWLKRGGGVSTENGIDVLHTGFVDDENVNPPIHHGPHLTTCHNLPGGQFIKQEDGCTCSAKDMLADGWQCSCGAAERKRTS